MTRWKGLVYNWDTFKEMDTGTESVPTITCLNQLEVALLLAAIRPMYWKATRWENLPESEYNYLDGVLSGIEGKLMCQDGCCDTVAYCILNSEAVQAALDQFAASSGWGDPAESDFPTSPTDLDCLWGGINAMVDFMRSDFETILDAIDSAASAVEAAGDWMNLFPSPAARYVGEVFAIAAGLGTAVLRATLTQGALDTMKCDLFCQVQAASDFTPPYDMTLELFLEWLEAYEQDDNPLKVGRNTLALCYVGLQVANDPVRYPVLSRRAAIQRYTLNIDNCSNDWEIVCTDCVWCHTWDFTANNGGWSAWAFGGVTRANYVAAQGWQQGYPVQSLDSRARDEISIETSGTETIGQVDVTITYAGITTGNQIDFVIWDGNDDEIGVVSNISKPSGAVTASLFIPSDTIVARIVILPRDAGTDIGGFITGITISGVGQVNPFGTTNC